MYSLTVLPYLYDLDESDHQGAGIHEISKTGPARFTLSNPDEEGNTRNACMICAGKVSKPEKTSLGLKVSFI